MYSLMVTVLCLVVATFEMNGVVGDGSSLRRNLDPYVYDEPVDPDMCDPEAPVKLYLYNADTDMPIGPLGDMIDSCMYSGVGLSIIGMPECKKYIQFTLYDSDGGELLRKTEGVLPFSLGGDRGVDVLPVKYLSMPGMYKIKTVSKPGGEQFFDFEVMRC